MAAFEARDARALRWPSKWTVYAVAFFYIMCSVGEALTVSHDDAHLRSTDDSICTGQSSPPFSASMIVIAAWNAGHKTLAGFLNGCLMFSVVSAANTSLYASSRSMYGLAQLINTPNWIQRKLEWVGHVDSKTGVPVGALLLSTLAFCWIPFLQLGCKREQVCRLSSLNVSPSIMLTDTIAHYKHVNIHKHLLHDRLGRSLPGLSPLLLLVRLLPSPHTHRLTLWSRLDKCDDVLQRDYPSFSRNSPKYAPRVNLQRFQPIPAWIGLIGCLLFFGFSSAEWWDHPERANPGNIASAYGVVRPAVRSMLSCLSRVH